MKLLSAFYYIVSISFIFLACAAPDKKLGIENGYCKEDNTCNGDDLVCFDDICIENKCKTINCLDNWLSCNPKDGRCTILKDGYCLQDSDCILDSEEICSGKHECVSKCISKTCDELSVECGIRDDGCGNSLDCGTCDIGEVCSKGVCKVKECMPITCYELSRECGIRDDECGNELNCGSCRVGEYCDFGKCKTSISDGELGAVCNEDLLCNENYLCLGADGDTHCYQPCDDVNAMQCIQDNYICQDIGNSDIGWICVPPQ